MFVLPEDWWLLALAVAPQLAFVAALAISRQKGTRIPGWAVALLCLGAVIGMVYGVVRSDAVFILGQVCVLLVVLIRRRLETQEDR